MLNSASSARSPWRILRTLLIIGSGLTVLLSLVRWGGTATTGPLYYGGVGLLTAVLVAFGGMVWWLLASPLRAAPAQPIVQMPGLRQVVAVLGFIAITFFIVGLLWDEIWHRRYGSFGDDFLWPPHMLIYGSMGLVALLAAGGMLMAWRSGGGLRQRFRTEPLIGLMGMMAAFMVVSTPSDLLWHKIYGKDLTAWSLPHLLLMAGITLVTLAALGVQVSVLPLRTWRGLRGLNWREGLAIALVALMGIELLQFGTTEWEGIRMVESASDNAFRAAFWTRPQWLYPVVVVSIALFCGNVALHALRRVGVATIVALLVLGFRLLSLTVFGGEGLGFVGHLLLLAPMVALDAWYAWRLRQAETLGTLVGGNLVAAGSFLVVGLPIIAQMMEYPAVNSYTLPPMIGMSVVMALASGWLGARASGWLGGLDRQDAPEQLSVQAKLASFGGFAAALAFALVVVLTAQPPV